MPSSDALRTQIIGILERPHVKGDAGTNLDDRLPRLLRQAADLRRCMRRKVSMPYSFRFEGLNATGISLYHRILFALSEILTKTGL